MDIYTAKNKIFNYLTKAQKSDLCHYIASFVKKHFNKEISDITDLFIEAEKHYLTINSSRFPWIDDYLENEEFLKELELYVKENRKKYLYKEKQKPLYEKQKAFAKEQRKKAQEIKMSKQPPTKAQISYYKALCKKNNIDFPLNEKTFSRLDFKNAISIILENSEYTKKSELFARLKKVYEKQNSGKIIK